MVTKLSCRMYQPRYPEVDRLVMGKVKSITGNEAVVSLLEFNEKEAKVFNSRERHLVVGRTMPFRVLDDSNKAILLSPNPLRFEDRMTCECEYSKAKHVQRVLFSVADDKAMNLKDLYKLAGWPSYDELLNLHEDQRFLSADIDADLKDFLLKRIKLMVYFSWRILNQRILQICLLLQEENICYAIALTRQFEAYLKLKGRLPFDSYLSIQDFVNKAVANELVHPKDASVPELGRFSYILKKLGLVLDADCPFKNSFDGEYIRTGGPVEKIDCMKVYEVGDDVPNSMAATDIITRLLIAPIACSVMLYPSYENSLREDKIYGPTDEEVETYEDDSSGLDCHTMLCTGHGVDRRGKEFLELQDSSGDVNAVDQGYVRFAHHNTVADYVYLEDFCPPAKKQKTH
ncbi:hypothetical protein BRARA_J02560 [Brassica rapa]|uniref:Uncharacterized protein n=2 Tax=Brassica TaxID=3705 RepID=A0A397XNG1_BRACM|nr:hypothetical protein BRARA_J02560 [Brassica rapa]CAF2357647.1 unnamed protein product [Brassica napus]